MTGERVDVLQGAEGRLARRAGLLAPVSVQDGRKAVEEHADRPVQVAGRGVDGQKVGAVGLSRGLGVVALGAQAQGAVVPAVPPIAPAHRARDLVPVRVGDPVFQPDGFHRDALAVPRAGGRAGRPFARGAFVPGFARALARFPFADAPVGTLFVHVGGPVREGFGEPRAAEGARSGRAVAAAVAAVAAPLGINGQAHGLQTSCSRKCVV